MSAKITASRRRAFIVALEQTGNQTLSAERAKVSRSWVCLQRSTDPAFDAACRDALAVAKLWVGDSESRKPGLARWARQDGHELVVRGTGGSGGGKRIQIARSRLRQWSPKVEARFLTALAASCNVKASCAAVGMHPPSAYNHRKRWPAFAERWDEALEDGYVRLEMALTETGCNLFSEPGLDSGCPPNIRIVEEIRECPPDIRISSMSAEQAIHLLHMHKYFMAGRVGKKPGLPERQPSFEEVGAYFTRALERLKRAKARGRRGGG